MDIIHLVEKDDIKDDLPGASTLLSAEEEGMGKGQEEASKTQGTLSRAHKTSHAEKALTTGDKVGVDLLSMAKDG
jgi:hypothetical protein